MDEITFETSEIKSNNLHVPTIIIVTFSLNYYIIIVYMQVQVLSYSSKIDCCYNNSR